MNHEDTRAHLPSISAAIHLAFDLPNQSIPRHLSMNEIFAFGRACIVDVAGEFPQLLDCPDELQRYLVETLRRRYLPDFIDANVSA